MDTSEEHVRELIIRGVVKGKIYPYGTVLIEEPATVKAEFYQCFFESLREMRDAVRQYAN
jgi:cytoskeletal protein CcmA (bactofilin family)